MNSKTVWAIGVVIIIVAIGAFFWHSEVAKAPTTDRSGAGTSASGSSAPIAGANERCGGNMLNAPVCGTGYHCAPEPGSHLPFGDVGGICVTDSIQTNTK